MRGRQWILATKKVACQEDKRGTYRSVNRYWLLQVYQVTMLAPIQQMQWFKMLAELWLGFIPSKIVPY